MRTSKNRINPTGNRNLYGAESMGWLGSRVVSVLVQYRAWVQIAAATLSGNSN